MNVNPISLMPFEVGSDRPSVSNEVVVMIPETLACWRSIPSDPVTPVTPPASAPGMLSLSSRACEVCRHQELSEGTEISACAETLC
jgi:hypothetical protein